MFTVQFSVRMSPFTELVSVLAKECHQSRKNRVILILIGRSQPLPLTIGWNENDRILSALVALPFARKHTSLVKGDVLTENWTEDKTR